MNAMKLGLDTERPIYRPGDTMPAPVPDFGELELPAPEVPPTLEELPEDEEPEECGACCGTGQGECVVPADWTFPGEYNDCEWCGGTGVRDGRTDRSWGHR